MTRSSTLLAVCILLVPTIAFAQTPAGTGVPVVFFSIFGPNGSELQRFYADVFEWKATPSGDVTITVTSPLMGTVGQGMPKRSSTSVCGRDRDAAEGRGRGGTIRFPRFEVPGRVILGMFKDPAGNSVGLVEMENGKAKVPSPPATKP